MSIRISTIFYLLLIVVTLLCVINNTIFVILIILPLLIYIYVLINIIKKLSLDIKNTSDMNFLNTHSTFKEINDIRNILSTINDKLLLKNQQYTIQNESILDFINFAIIGIDKDYNVKVWNKSTEELLGFSIKDTLNSSIINFIPDGYKKFHKNIINEIFDKNVCGYVIKNHNISIDINGRTIHANLSVCLTRDELLMAFIEENNDILSQQAYFNAAYNILDYSDTVVFTIKAMSLVCVFISKSIKKLLGYDDWEIYNNDDGLLCILSDLNKKDFINKIDILICRNSMTQTITEQFTLIHKNGEKIHTEIVFFPIKDKNGLSIYVQGVIKNITSQINYQELLKNYNKDLENVVNIKTEELMIANKKLQEVNELLIYIQKQSNKNIMQLLE